jgi:transcriptional regulator with XRE-family HTH domain
MDNIQDRILTIMSIKNVTNAEFAQAIGVQPSNISHILSGRNKPSLDLVMKIVKRYPEVRLEWLLRGGGSMNKEFGTDLFSGQKESNGALETGISANKLKMKGQSHDAQQISPAFASKTQYEVLETPLEQQDTKVSNETNKSTGKVEISDKEKKLGLEVEKIVIFYSDKTYKEYSPRSG